MTIEERFPIGSKVRVVSQRPADCRSGPGWDDDIMDALLGKEGIVQKVNRFYTKDGEVTVLVERFHQYRYLAHWLEPVVDAKPDLDPQMTAANRRRDEIFRQMFS